MNKKTGMSGIMRGAIVFSAAVVAIAGMTVFGGWSNVNAGELTDATVQKYEEQISKLAKETEALLNKLYSTRNEKQDAQEYKRSLDLLVSSLDKKMELTNQMLDELEEQITTKKSEIEQKSAEIDACYAKFLERLQFSYEEGTASYLEIILGSEDMSDFLARMDRISNILEADRALMAQYETEKANMNAALEALDAALLKQQEYKKQLEADQGDAAVQVYASENYIKTLSANEAEYNRQYKKAQEEMAKIDAELEAYLKELQEKENAAYVGGEFRWPLDPSIKRISSYFGKRNNPLGSGTENHGAIDIPAPAGTPILAANSGKVLKAEWHYSYGYYVLIDHGGGKSTLYAHCSSLLVSVGEKVEYGQTIAKVGTTGYSTGNHLHFEVRENGKRVDPLGYVTVP